MKSDDLPPPMPGTHEGDEATHVGHKPWRDGGQTLRESEEDIPGVTGTGAKVNLRAIEESGSVPSLPGSQAVAQANLQRRIPVAARNRPTLMPAGYEEPPKLPHASRVPDPSLVRPVRPAPELSRVPVGKLERDSSDVIQMFASAGSSPAVPSPIQARRPTVPPPPANSGKLLRRAVPAPAPAPAPARPQPPSVLPLQPERMALLIAEHRNRLQTLDFMARGLEIGAGVLGMLAIIALATTFAAVVSGHSPGVLVTTTACIACATGLATSGLLVALSVGLRHQAHTGAQVAALLEALSGQHR